MAVGGPALENGGNQSNRESELTHALAAVRSRLAIAAQAAARNVGEIELLPITKFFPATDVAILSRLGCRSVGESREQEASAKVAELTRLRGASRQADSGTDLTEVHWHMVGQ
ncbi:MAG: YggS family pyridoxal phosphate enzyme, partial [Mycobacterium sp.]